MALKPTRSITGAMVRVLAVSMPSAAQSSGCRRAARSRRVRSQPWRTLQQGRRAREKRGRKPVSTPPRDEFAHRQAARLQGEIGGHAVDARVAPAPARMSCSAAGRSGPCHDDLGQQRIIVRRTRASRPRCACPPGSPAPLGQLTCAHRARAGPKILRRVLGVDAALDGAAARPRDLLAQAQRPALGDGDLLGDEIHAGHRLGHRVLHLDARIHLQEIELVALGSTRNSTVPAPRYCRRAAKRTAASCSAAAGSAAGRGAGVSSSSFW